VRNPAGSGRTLPLDDQSRSPEVLMSAMGELAIISVYCPDQLQAFQEYRDRLDTAEVVG